MTNISDERYLALRLPLKSIGGFIESSDEALAKEESEILEGTTFRRLGKTGYHRGSQVIHAGDLDLIAGRITPALYSNSSTDFSCFFAMPFMGGFTSTAGGAYSEAYAGDIYFNQNFYGESILRHHSALFVGIDRMRLDRAIHTISGSETLMTIGTCIVLRGDGSRSQKSGASKMWSLMHFIDQLHWEHAYMPTALGMGEQFYRLLSITLLEGAGRI